MFLKPSKGSYWDILVKKKERKKEIEPSNDWEMKLKKQRGMEKTHFAAKLAEPPKLYAYVYVSSAIETYILLPSKLKIMTKPYFLSLVLRLYLSKECFCWAFCFLFTQIKMQCFIS